MELSNPAAQWAEFKLWCVYGLAFGLVAHYFARFNGWRKGSPIKPRTAGWQVTLVLAVFAVAGYSQTLRPFHQLTLLGNGQVVLDYPTGKQINMTVRGGFANPQRGVLCIVTLSDGKDIVRSDMIATEPCHNALEQLQKTVPGF